MKFNPATAVIGILLVLLGITSFKLFNQPTQTQNQSVPNLLVDEQSIIENLNDKLDFEIDSIEASPVPGLMQVYTNKGLFYVSKDGEYFLQARVYNIEESVIDETENALKVMRINEIENFKVSAIEFKSQNEDFVINVFTDATCGYCRKLHNEMQQLNDEGITVRYLAWPRAGINSQVYKDTVSIWCSEDPHQAMTDAKAGRQVDSINCENSVADQYKFGLQIGINATPSIVLPDGSVVRGYLPAKTIAQTLRQAS